MPITVFVCAATDHGKRLPISLQLAANWSLTGNTGTDSTLNFIGTVDGKPLVMKTNNTERLRINSNGNIGIGTNTPTAALDVNGTVKLENLASNSTQTGGAGAGSRTVLCTKAPFLQPYSKMP